MPGHPGHPVTRFLALVDRTSISRTSCWIWGGAGKGNGYGSFSLAGSTLPAHRAAYILFNGRDPGLMDVCHRCDNRACVNPDHLFLGTRLENMQDCMRKGRTARGERLGNRRADRGSAAKLTWDQVNAIRSSGEPAKVLAARYGVTNDNINRIRRNDTWKVAS